MNIFNKKVPSPKSQVPREYKHCRLSTRHFRLSTSSGFTIVETLVAIAILMIAIAGPLTVAEKGLSASIYARDQLMASYLAQDAMESIKNIVDSNQLAGNSWLNSLSACNSSSSLCAIDTIASTVSIIPCTTTNGNPCQPLYLGSSGYTMTVTPNVTANFTRYFYIQGFNLDGSSCSSSLSACTAANVVVNVTWPGDVIGGGGVQLEDTMFNTPLQ